MFPNDCLKIHVTIQEMIFFPRLILWISCMHAVFNKSLLNLNKLDKEHIYVRIFRNTIDSYIIPLIIPKNGWIMPNSLEWWNDGCFIEEVTQIYHVFQSKFCKRVFVHPTVDTNQ